MTTRSPEGVGVKIRRSHIIVTSVILLGLIFMTLGVYFLTDHPRYFAHSLRLPQEADSVAGYPIAVGGEGENTEYLTAEFQPNLSQLSPMERFRLPTAPHFLRPTTAAASAHGLVLYTGNPDGYPGQAVLLGHRLPNGDIIQTFYAGLSQINVSVGTRVAQDETLGTVKDTLFFEIREGAGIDIQQEEINGIALNPSTPSAPNRIDPDTFFASYPETPPAPDAFAIMRQEELESRSTFENLRLDPESAIKLHELTRERSPE